MPLAPGTQLGSFQIMALLGMGGMGEVYKAQDLELQRTVALKFLRTDIAVSERDKESLLREARAASALDHPNIGVIFSVEETPDRQLYMVMGFYDGETLAQKFTRGPIPLPEALDLTIQIARGLSAAHARNIVHRDVKPSNIIITSDGLVKIVDFGLARVVASSSATQTLQASGTLPYMAPEQILAEPVDQRSDVWAVGVILVQILSGSHPFLRDNSSAMSFAILNQPPASLSTLPALLQPVAYRALSKKPEFRYPTGKEMLADLETAKLEIANRPAAAMEEGATLSKVVFSSYLKEFVERASTPRWSTAPLKKISTRKGIYAGLAVVLMAVAGLLVPQVRQWLANLLAPGGENHIAVLPFDNIGNDPTNDLVAQGLMDSLTSELSDLSAAQQSLWVVPASVVRSRRIADPSAAFRELGANMVVKGSIRREGQAVHLTVNLIDAKRLRQVGSAALDDRAGDLAALQDEAVARLARLMKINVTAGKLQGPGGNVAPAAYESYLKALGYVQRYDKPGNLDLAVSVLQEAVKADPQFALGYAQLGDAYRLKYRLDSNPKWIDEVLANCRKAIQVDDRLASAYVTLGRIHEGTGNHDLAVQEFQHALSLDNRNADALGGIARSYENAGRLTEAEASYKKAVALRPDYWDGYDELGLYYDRHNKYPEAIVELRRAAELTPDNAQVYSNLGAVYIDTGDPKLLASAEQALNKSVQLSPSYAAYANLGSVLYDQRRYSEATAMTEKALQINGENYLVWNWLVNDYEWLKLPDKANSTRERAIELAERSAKLNPQDGMVQAVLASLYGEKQMPEKARTHLQTALALSPDDPEVLEDSAVVHELLGERAQAIKYANAALKKGYSLDKIKNDPDLQGLVHDPTFHPRTK